MATIDTPHAGLTGGGTPPTSRSGGPGGGSGLTRVTVNLTRKAVEALESVSDATGYSKTDTINRALQVYAIVQQLMEDNGGKLRLRRDNGDVEVVPIV